MKPISFPAFLNALVPAAGTPSPMDAVEGFSKLLSKFEASSPSDGAAAAAPVPVGQDPGSALPIGLIGSIVLADGSPDPAPTEPVTVDGQSNGGPAEAEALPAPDRSGLPAWAGLQVPVPLRMSRTDAAVSASEDEPADDQNSAQEEAQWTGGQPVPVAVPVQIPLPPPVVPAGSDPSSAIEQLDASRFGSGNLALPQRPLHHGAAAPFEQKPGSDPVAGPATTDLPTGNLALVIERNGLAEPISNASKAPQPGLPASPADSSRALGVDSDLHQLDALVRDIAELSGSSARAAFKVEGRELGQVDVRLHASDAGVSVAIRTDNEHGRSAVAAAQGQLSDDMRSNGLKLAATSISFGQGGAERHRDDRHHESRPAFVESAATETKRTQSTTDRRPSGRFA
jgi:hypothetical protein